MVGDLIVPRRRRIGGAVVASVEGRLLRERRVWLAMWVGIRELFALVVGGSQGRG